jgi:hypothetical protein
MPEANNGKSKLTQQEKKERREIRRNCKRVAQWFDDVRHAEMINRVAEYAPSLGGTALSLESHFLDDWPVLEAEPGTDNSDSV